MSQPSTNHFKFGASGISSATRGGFSVGVKEGADYGPTSSTGFWNGVKPPVGGYTIYVDKASQGPSIHVASNNAQCIGMLLHMGATGSTIENVLAWADGQANMAVLSAELTLGDLPGAPVTYTIGQAALGGIIAYINGGGSTGTSGLVATVSDISTSTEWGCVGTTISGADGTAIGTGNQNTIDIMAGCATAGIAARICGDLTQSGYSDWYLPSKDELNALYTNKASIGGFANDAYWSSTEYHIASAAYYQDFSNGFVTATPKNSDLYVRAVRSFGGGGGLQYYYLANFGSTPDSAACASTNGLTNVTFDTGDIGTAGYIYADNMTTLSGGIYWVFDNVSRKVRGASYSGSPNNYMNFYGSYTTPC